MRLHTAHNNDRSVTSVTNMLCCAALCMLRIDYMPQEVERDAAVATWRRLTASCHAKQQQLDAAEAALAAAAAAGEEESGAATAAALDADDLHDLKVCDVLRCCWCN